jgi:hemolysin activation/secretion protein
MLFESYMTIKSQFQAASVGLPSSEQLQLGGANSVRGYPEGDYLCDTGATLNIDWAFPCYLLPKELKLPNSTVPLRNQIELVVFMDLAGGVLKRVLPGEDSSKFLMGIGGGLRIRLYNKVYCRLDWAVDVGDDPVSGSGPSTFYLTFQSEI